MTREELVEILEVCLDGEFTRPDVLADRILLALEKEREGDVVLEDGVMGEDFMMEATCNSIELNGKQGQLIFRPTKAEKGGEE